MPVAQRPPVSGGTTAVSRASLWGAIVLLAASVAAGVLIARRFPAEPADGSARVRRTVPPPVEALRPGLLGEYWELGREIPDFPAVPETEASLTRVDARIHFERSSEHFARAGLNDRFCVRWIGVIRIPRNGKYGFFLESDDGSRLYLDGRLAVDNGGRHEMKEIRGDVDLAAGDCEFRLEFFDDLGVAGCVLSWEGPGIPREIVPASAYFHRRR